MPDFCFYIYLKSCIIKEIEIEGGYNIKELFIVTRPKDKVVVSIFKNKSDNTYSFVNLTKEHICPCRFPSVEEALLDMDKKIEEGTVLKYEKIGE